MRAGLDADADAREGERYIAKPFSKTIDDDEMSVSLDHTVRFTLQIVMLHIVSRKKIVMLHIVSRKKVPFLRDDGPSRHAIAKLIQQLSAGSDARQHGERFSFRSVTEPCDACERARFVRDVVTLCLRDENHAPV